MGCGQKNKLPGLPTVLLRMCWHVQERGGLVPERGACAVMGQGLGAFLRCELIVYLVKLRSYWEGAGCICDLGQIEMAQR